MLLRTVTMRHARVLALASVATLLLLSAVPAGAQSPSAGEASPASGATLEGTHWLLGEIINGDESTPVASGVNASLVLSDGSAGGFGGCNQFVTSYELSGDSLSFGDVASTLIACDEATMAFEDQYFAALGLVASYAIDGTALTLANADGATVLNYTASPPATVEGPWYVTGYNNGAEAVVSPVIGAEPSISFHPDGTVEGFGGCNGFGGGYSVHDDAIAIGPLHSTMIACSDEINAQEVQFLTALEAATTWELSGNTLTLRDDAGAMQVTAVSAIGF
jgi:heat shock protein HslJ